MPFYQDGAIARRKASFMDDSAIEISDSDFDAIAQKLEQGGTFTVDPDGAVTLFDPDPEDYAFTNKQKAIGTQALIINTLAEDADRSAFGLPSLLAPNQVEHLKDQLQTLQHTVDNPPATADWEPHPIETHPLWNPDTHYQIGDVVSHNGAIWEATSNNTGNEPDDVPGDWEKVS